MKTKLCVCTSGKLFDQCCKPLLDQTTRARTPQALMRSRFSAFSLGGYGDYLLNTWLPDTSIGLEIADLSQRSLNWQRLDIVEKSQKGESATVEFKAYFLDPNSEERVHHERSRFQRLSGNWVYVDGDILS